MADWTLAKGHEIATAVSRGEVSVLMDPAWAMRTC